VRALGLMTLLLVGSACSSTGVPTGVFVSEHGVVLEVVKVDESNYQVKAPNAKGGAQVYPATVQDRALHFTMGTTAAWIAPRSADEFELHFAFDPQSENFLRRK
jgi:hypothetical protein